MSKPNKKNIQCIIDGKEYPSLVDGCSALGLDYGYARLKHHRKGDKFEMKKIFVIEVKK